MLADCSGLPSAGQKPASSGKPRKHVGQLFMSSEDRDEN
jgi:hypothetical protein